MFVDIHTHNSSKSENPAILNLAFSEAENVFSSNEQGLFSVGIHPWNADDKVTESLQNIEKWIADERFVAIGECGLDKNSKVSIEKQVTVFEQQISLSEKHKKPMIIHCVSCYNELFEIKKRINPHQLWIIHGLRAKPELVKQALKAGFGLSFGEFFNKESVRITPVDRLFIETDESSILITELYYQIATLKEIEPMKLNAGELLYMQLIGK